MLLKPYFQPTPPTSTLSVSDDVLRVVEEDFQPTPPTFTLSASDDVARVTEQWSVLLNLIFRQRLPPSLSLL